MSSARNSLPDWRLQWRRRLKRRLATVPRTSIAQELERLSARQPVTFIQIGAHDGHSGDLLHPYIVNGRWRGILVEPVPDLFNRLRTNYQSYSDRLIFENSAIAERPGVKTFFAVKQSSRPDAVPWHTQLGSFDKRNILKHADRIPDLEQLIYTIPVATLTVRELTQKHGIGHLDLVAVDTEGYDAVIVGNLLAEGVSPTVIIFEHKHLSVFAYLSLLRQLRRRGYTVYRDGANAIAIKRQEHHT